MTAPLSPTVGGLIDCSYGGNIAGLAILLDSGMDINAIEENTGLSPLHIAVGTNNLDLVRFVLAKGAKVGPDRQGRWPSTIAELCECDEELLDLIVDAETALGNV